MNNNENKKSSSIVLYIFAAIGVVAVIALLAIGVITLVKGAKDKLTRSLEATEDIKTVELEEKEITDTEGAAAESVNKTSENSETADASAAQPSGTANSDSDFQIVFLGDSILDNVRDNTGICNLIGNSLEAKIINCAVGGMTASYQLGEEVSQDTAGLYGVTMAKIIAGEWPVSCLERYSDLEAIKTIKAHQQDFKNTDVFVIEYGINDFMYGRFKSFEDSENDPHCFVGAMRVIVDTLQNAYPDAQIILTDMSYVQYFRENGEYIGNTFTINEGQGTPYEYSQMTQYVAGEKGCILFPLDKQGVSEYNADSTLIDGVHMNEFGRYLYAANLTRFIHTHIFNEETSYDVITDYMPNFWY